MWHFKDVNITKRDCKRNEKLKTNTPAPVSQNFIVMKRIFPDEVKLTTDERPTNFNIKEVVNLKMELCRVCLKQGTLPIHGNYPNKDLACGLSTIGGIDVSIFDAYPKYLCKSCYLLLQGALLFRSTALSSDRIFKKYSAQVPVTDDNIKSNTIDIDNQDCDVSLEAREDSSTITNNQMEPYAEMKSHLSESFEHIVTETPCILEPQVCLNTVALNSPFRNFMLSQTKTHTKSNQCAVDHKEKVCELNSQKQYDWKCEKCNIQLDSLQHFKEHEVTRDSFKTCVSCKKNIADPFAKKINIMSQETEDMNVCDNKYKDIPKLHKPDSKNYLKKVSMECVGKALEEQNVVLICKQCNIEFDKLDEFKDHMLRIRKHKQKLCTICKKQTSTRFIRNNNISVKITGIYVCGICYKSDTSKPTQSIVSCDEKKVPSSFIVREPKLKCDQCNKSINLLPDYKAHIHTHGKKIKCPICYQSFHHNTYKKHMKSHKMGAEYVCDICGKHFNWRNSFINHRGTHFNNLPYKCSLCPYRTLLSFSLKTHMRSHTGERPYLCEECPKTFVTKSNLIKHSLCHKKDYDFKCGCGKEFHTNKQLELHVKVDHHGVKEHVCQFCGKAYGCRKVMMRHQVRVHKRAKLRSGILPTYLKIDNTKNQDEANITSETT